MYQKVEIYDNLIGNADSQKNIEYQYQIAKMQLPSNVRKFVLCKYLFVYSSLRTQVSMYALLHLLKFAIPKIGKDHVI